MDKIYTDINLDFNDNNSMQTVYVQQGDKNGGRVLRVALYNNGVRINLNASSDSAALYAAVGNTVLAMGESLTISNNKVEIPISEALSGVSGQGDCVIQISSSSGKAGAPRFHIDIGEDPTAEKTEVVKMSELIDRIERLEAQSATPAERIAQYIEAAIDGAFPTWEKTIYYVELSNAPTLTGSTTAAYYLIPASVFDPEKDGLLIWQNDYQIIAKKIGENLTYTFETFTGSGGTEYVKIVFDETWSTIFYNHTSNATVTFEVYKKPE